MLGYLILGTTAMMAHSFAGLVEAPITYPRAPLYSGGQNCSNVFYFWKESPISLEIKY